MLPEAAQTHHPARPSLYCICLAGQQTISTSRGQARIPRVSIHVHHQVCRLGSIGTSPGVLISSLLLLLLGMLLVLGGAVECLPAASGGLSVDTLRPAARSTILPWPLDAARSMDDLTPGEASRWVLLLPLPAPGSPVTMLGDGSLWRASLLLGEGSLCLPAPPLACTAAATCGSDIRPSRDWYSAGMRERCPGTLADASTSTRMS